MHYYGTNFKECGHYFWDITYSEFKHDWLDIIQLGFNPEKLNVEKRIGATTLHGINGYSICRIEGSCTDKRSGSISVFFIKEQLNASDLINKIKSNKLAMSIINSISANVEFF
jgi:hypothetical protein